MTCQPKASTLEHHLWRMQDWIGVEQALSYWSWPHRNVNPGLLVREGIDVSREDVEYFFSHHLIPYYLLLTGALPGEAGSLPFLE